MLGAQPAWKPPLLCAPPLPPRERSPAAPASHRPRVLVPLDVPAPPSQRPQPSSLSSWPLAGRQTPDALSPRCPSSTRPTCPVCLGPQPPRAHGLSWLRRPQPFHLPGPSTPFPGPSTPSSSFCVGPPRPGHSCSHVTVSWFLFLASC